MNPRAGEICDTIFFQGINSAQTQALKYVGDKKIQATTGELMWCMGRNHFPPINVIERLHIGREIADVNLQPFATYTSMLNPINWIGAAMSWVSNYCNGYKFLPAINPTPQSVAFHAPILTQMSIGQQSDIESHRRKYQTWLERPDRTPGLILFGVSRGTAATFCAFTKEKYPEVRLVVLEGAIDTIPNVLQNRYKHRFNSAYWGDLAARSLMYGLSFFTPFKSENISPLSCVNQYPENVPTVFITSKTDKSVPCENTTRIAQTLANRGKNDVYLLTLDQSSHPNYMFDNQNDHDAYETFMHAIYKKYGLSHDVGLAEKGESLLAKHTLYEQENTKYRLG